MQAVGVPIRFQIKRLRTVLPYAFRYLLRPTQILVYRRVPATAGGRASVSEDSVVAGTSYSTVWLCPTHQ